MAATALHRIAKSTRPWMPSFLFDPLRAALTAVATPARFSFATGHFRNSLARTACSADGLPLPWYTYPAIDFLAQREFKGRDVLEFGGGQSTLWWQTRARSVLTVEGDRDWYRRIVGRMGANVNLHHVPVEPEDSLQQVRKVIEGHTTRKFDVIIIDGHRRRELAGLAFEYLAPGGAILLDNAEGYGFYEETRARHCRRVDFFGFAPGVSLRHCTSLVFVDDCFLLMPDIAIPEIDEPA
ncbi:MAG: hypothetical protein ACHQK9_10905 [Reyranellales bacterium]